MERVSVKTRTKEKYEVKFAHTDRLRYGEVLFASSLLPL